MKRIEKEIVESSEVIANLIGQARKIEEASRLIVETLRIGKKILLCGNGGSAADAQHLAAEIVVRYRKKRKAYPAIALTVDTSILTACSNDFGYDTVFSRQIEALGREGDLLIAISTSGKSPNIREAVQKAKELKLKIIYLTGINPPQKSELCDIVINAPTKETARIQECHGLICHIFAKVVEDEFGGKT